MSSKVLDLLRSMDLFTDLPDAELNKIARLLKEHKFAENELIFTQGEPGDGLYIILQGRVRIASTDQLGRERVLAFYGPGEFFGDMAVLTGAPRSATASASTNLRVLQLRKDDFDVLVATSVGMMRGMLRVLIPRTALAAITPAAIRSLDRDNLAYYMTKHPESSLRVMCGTLRPEESELVSGDHVRAIVDVLRRQFVHVVIDAGSRFSEPCLAALELADQIMLVTTPEPSAAHATQESQRVLRDLLGVPPERIRYVQNQPSPYGKLSRTDLAELVGSDQVVEVPFGGEEVTKAGLNGFPLVMGHSANPTSRAILGLARELELSGRELLALSR